MKNNTREALDGQEAFTERKGDLHGIAYYAQLGFWPLGNRDINGQPGYEIHRTSISRRRIRKPGAISSALVRWEQLNATYASASRTNTANPNTDGDIKVNAFSLGANYWATKHVRLTLNYVFNMFPDSSPGTGPYQGSPTQRAIAPAQTLRTGVNDDARANGHVSHELLGRMAVAF